MPNLWEADRDKKGEHKKGEHKKGEHKEGEHKEGEHKEGEHKEGEHKVRPYDTRAHPDGAFCSSCPVLIFLSRRGEPCVLPSSPFLSLLISSYLYSPSCP